MTAVATFPWPPAALSPNGAHGHWTAKSKAAREYKAECIKACLSVGMIDADAVEVGVIFQPPRNGRYDLDNQLARIKQGLDAFAAAIGIDDGRWTSMTLERGDKTPGGAIHVYAVPSRWRSIGCITASMVEKKARERLAPSRAVATHNGETIMGSQEGITGKEGAQ